jgi:hypothetical protein
VFDPDPVLPDRAREDTDAAWGTDPDHDRQTAHDEWLRRQRPPHHEG